MYNHEESDNFFFNSNYTINYWISKGADRKKLVMGMPMVCFYKFVLAYIDNLNNLNNSMDNPSHSLKPPIMVSTLHQRVEVKLENLQEPKAF
jgi:hypothetical protein